MNESTGAVGSRVLFPPETLKLLLGQTTTVVNPRVTVLPQKLQIKTGVKNSCFTPGFRN